MTETCPTFLAHGDTISEVVFTEWEFLKLLGET